MVAREQREDTLMLNKLALTISAAAIAIASMTASVHAQGTPQTVSAVTVQKLSTGYRSTKIVGSNVVNDKNEAIGKIDDLIISRDDRALFAILSVGGFLGVGNRLVAVPYDRLTPSTDNRKFVVAGASKDALKTMPEYKYAP
jgi:hypothetical protein